MGGGNAFNLRGLLIGVSERDDSVFVSSDQVPAWGTTTHLTGLLATLPGVKHIENHGGFGITVLEVILDTDDLAAPWVCGGIKDLLKIYGAEVE